MPNGTWFVPGVLWPASHSDPAPAPAPYQGKAICYQGGEMAVVAHVVLSGLTKMRVTFYPAHEVYLPQAVTITA
jgi:hypothetical protein